MPCDACDICNDLHPNVSTLRNRPKRWLSACTGLASASAPGTSIDVLRGAKGQTESWTCTMTGSHHGIGADLSARSGKNINPPVDTPGYLVRISPVSAPWGSRQRPRPVLKGEIQVTLGLPPRYRPDGKEKTRAGRAAPERPPSCPCSKELRAERKQKSPMGQCATLSWFFPTPLCSRWQKSKPRHERELLSITGVGEHQTAQVLALVFWPGSTTTAVGNATWHPGSFDSVQQSDLRPITLVIRNRLTRKVFLWKRLLPGAG